LIVNRFLKSKESENKGIIYKARLVARGFSQRQGTDCEATFSRVIRYSTTRLDSSGESYYDHVDVVTAFLHEDLNETVYMRHP
jgi:hypothetical protein